MEAAAFVRLRAPYIHRYSGFHPCIKSYSFLRRQCNGALTLASTVPARGLTCNAGSQMEPIDDDADGEISYLDSLFCDSWDKRILNELENFCDDYAFKYYQVLVEVRWLLKLSEIPELKEVPTFSQETRAFLENIIQEFNVDEALEVKNIEEVTNHDVKAVVYYLKRKCKSHSEVSKVLEFFHSTCTSEDINNLAYGLLVKDAINHVMFPVMTNLCKAFCAMARNNAHIAMLLPTHGQASRTTLGIEMATFGFRLGYWAQRMSQVRIFGKFAGVVGKYNSLKFTGEYNACKLAYRDIDWPSVAQEFVTSFGLQFNPYATQMTKVGEIGSCTVPRIDFGNSRSRMPCIDFANSLSNLLMEKAGLAAMSRNVSTPGRKSDLTNILMPFTWFGLVQSLVAYKKFLQVIEKLQVNESRLAEDLEKNWVVLAEAIQIVMGRYAVPEPYEKLKELTRGRYVDEESILSFIENLDLPEEEKLYLLNLTPHAYIGEAENLAKLIDKSLGSLLGFKIR